MKKAGRTRLSTPGYIAARRADAAEFMRAAGHLDAEGYHPDVVVTLAVHAAIAAADVICSVRLGKHSADGNHDAAVALLREHDAKLAGDLDTVLRRKQRAGYSDADLTPADSKTVLRSAERLLQAAQQTR
ncbi:MAG: hypothetical protein AB7W59_24255 [Acidimicrobiia bacterium]